MNHRLRLALLICSQLIVYAAHAQLQKIFINPKAAGSEKQSKFVDSLRFISLEAVPGIELSQYSSAEPTRDYFIIRNYYSREIILYGKDGRFVNKISHKKLGNEFYPVYDERTNQIVFFGANKNYTLTPRDKIKISLDWNNPRNRKYYKKYTIDLGDPTFTFALREETPQQKDIVRAFHFYDDVYATGKVSTSELYKDSLEYELKLYSGNEFTRGYFPYNRINEPKYLFTTEEGLSTIKTDTPYIHYITRPFCDTVYKMVRDNVEPVYQIVLPLENSLPTSFFTTPFKNKTDRDNHRRNNGWMLHQIYSVYETPRFIYFQIGYLSNYESYIYQKQTKTTHKVRNIKADTSQYNLTLLNDYNVVRKQDKFYRTVKAGDILSYFEKNKEAVVPPDLERILKTKPAATTPLIIEFKFKN